MSRTRSERRFFTRRYVKKQENLYKLYNRDVWDSGYSIEPHKSGQWKNHSFCNTGGCQCCGNPRHVKWEPKERQITIQERRADDSFKDQLGGTFTSTDDGIC